MIDYTKVPLLSSMLACYPRPFPQSSPDSGTPDALLDNTSSPDNTTSVTNQDDATLDTSPPSSSYGFIELLVMLISQLAFFAHQLRRISKVVDVLSSSSVTLEQTTDLEMTNLHITMELVKQDLVSRIRYPCRRSATPNRQPQQTTPRGMQTLRDIKNLEKLTSCISRGDNELDAFHGRLHGQLACQVKDQLRTQNDDADLRKELDAFHERLHGQLICQVKDQLRTENDVVDLHLRKDIPKTLSLYHTRTSALEFALSQAKPPASPQVVVYDSKPVRRATFAEANPLPEQVRPDPQNLPIPTSTAPKTQRSGISTPATSLRFIDQNSARTSSKAVGIPTKPTTPNIPTTVDSVRRPVTVKPSVSRVLLSSKIATPGTKVSSAPKAGVSKTSTPKGEEILAITVVDSHVRRA
ncbi:hypothetical protein DFH29DRAFT_1014748 [Suillus ampliporus]|nr:hypothetical protein DFH29DRAFT_1014748 [Suillus ampliporus]